MVVYDTWYTSNLEVIGRGVGERSVDRKIKPIGFCLLRQPLKFFR